MATSYVFYPNETGARTDYPIPFEYLSSTFVKATVNGASVPFSLLSTYMIRFTTAPLGALKIYRQTSSAPVNTFTNGSILVDTQLNGSFLQSLHVSEEVTDNSLQTASDGAWDAANLKVKNVADPTSAKDAANKSYVDARLSTDKGEIDAAKVAAEAAAADASFSNTAAGSAASSAANSAGAAGASATNASNSATAANNSATLAWYYAMQPEDVAIPGGGFSALHYAAKAAAALGSMLNGLAGWIHGATSKTTPVDNDEVAISDSAATWGLKKVSWASVKGTLKTYFDTLYSATGHTHTFASLTSKPNTISGYGITDAAAKSDGDDSTAVAGTSTTQKTWPATSLKAGALAFTLGGSSQSWQDMSASREFATAYQNTTGRPIWMCCQYYGTGGSGNTIYSIEVSANGTTWFTAALTATAGSPTNSYTAISGLVPVGHYYRLSRTNGTGTVKGLWAELR